MDGICALHSFSAASHPLRPNSTEIQIDENIEATSRPVQAMLMHKIGILPHQVLVFDVSRRPDLNTQVVVKLNLGLH
jgi:hypothetical protein